MALRCIYCGRSSKRTQLTGRFTCVDGDDCDTAVANKTAIPVSIFADAACSVTPTSGNVPMGIGIYTLVAGQHAPEYCGSKFIGDHNVNTGEWTALIAALRVAILMRKEKNYTFRIFGDNQAVYRMFNGEYKVGVNSKPYFIEADRLRLKLGVSLLSVSWIPRSENQQADILSKEAIQHLKK